MKLNIGCGESYLEGFINVDTVSNAVIKADLIHDIKSGPFPYRERSVDEIWMIHSLEHIEMAFWPALFIEYRRLLKDNGKILLSYPEFGECAKRFLDNHDGKRDWFRKTLYGRQLYPGDYHVTPMHSHHIKEFLESIGYYRVSFRPESDNEPYNTIMAAMRDPDHIMREDVLVKELHLGFKDGFNYKDKVG